MHRRRDQHPEGAADHRRLVGVDKKGWIMGDSQTSRPVGGRFSKQRPMHRITGVVILAVGVACSGGADPEIPATTTEAATETTSADGTTPLIGSWHRAQTCEEMLAAFEEAGLAETHVGWLQGNFFGVSRVRPRVTPVQGRVVPWSMTISSRRPMSSDHTTRTVRRSTAVISRSSMTTRWAFHPTPPSLATTVTSSSTTPWTARS